MVEDDLPRGVEDDLAGGVEDDPQGRVEDDLSCGARVAVGAVLSVPNNMTRCNKFTDFIDNEIAYLAVFEILLFNIFVNYRYSCFYVIVIPITILSIFGLFLSSFLSLSIFLCPHPVFRSAKKLQRERKRSENKAENNIVTLT